MITVHHLENSRSQRIIWLLEELGVEYQVKRYERDKESSLAPAELVAIHPLGKSPVITDGEITVAESGAIVEYLVDRFDQGRLRPAPGSAQRLQYTYWLHYAEGTFMPLMVMSLIMNRVASSPMPFFAKPVAKGIVGKVRANYLGPNISRNLDFMEAALSRHDWFCGEHMTAADIMMSFPVEAAQTRLNQATHYPRLSNFLNTIRAMPAYQTALEKGGPYSLVK